MCFRIIYYLVSFYCLFNVCFADETRVRAKRADDSAGFGQMLMDLLSGIFGSDTNTTETVNKPVNVSFNGTLQQFGTTLPGSGLQTQENTTATNVLSQQEVVTLDNSTASIENMTSSSKPFGSSNSFVPSASTVTASTVTSTTKTSSQTDPSTCSKEPLLRSYCQVPKSMTDLSVWSVYYVLFSDAVVQSLTESCTRGTWCLQDNIERWQSLIQGQVALVTKPSSLLTTLCNTEFQPCMAYVIQQYKKCPQYPNYRITFEAAKLVCELKENTVLAPPCYQQVLTVLHITLADLLRNDTKQESDLSRCQSSEANMTKGLICVENACPGESKKFHSFEPWVWFISVEDDLMIECKMDPGKCEALLPALPATNGTQEVTSQATDQQTTTSSLTTSPSSSSSSSFMLSSTTQLPAEDNKCYTDAILQNYCPVPDDMTDVAFWDLYSVLFSDSVLDALMYGCTKGAWCLKDRFDYWESLIVERVDMVMNSEIATSMCLPTIEKCLPTVVNSFTNCSMYGQMVYTTEVINLICGLKQNKELTSECYKHVISAAHVTLADILRTKDYDEDDTDKTDTCESPEAQMTKGLICVENSCPGEAKAFQSFKPWSWFTSVVNDLIVGCDFDPTTCKALLTPPPGYLASQLGTVVGISMAIMITAITLMIVAGTCYKRHRRNAVVKEGYQRLLTDGDES